jgi:hypothetical protein
LADIALDNAKKSAAPFARGAMILFFISAAVLVALITLVSDQSAFSHLSLIVRRQPDLFEGFFYSLLGFTFVYIVIIFAYVSRMRFIERLFALLVCMVSAGNTLFSFALLYGGLGLKRDGLEIIPSSFEATFFSAMVFSGNGWAEYSPGMRTYTAVAVQSVASYIFVPLLLSALVLIFDKRSSDGAA